MKAVASVAIGIGVTFTQAITGLNTVAALLAFAVVAVALLPFCVWGAES